MTAAPERPDISVIIPAFNSAATIRTAVESVLAERSVALEVLVVDDASSDDTAVIVEAMVADDPRVILLRQAVNGGASVARNVALDVARGEWIAFVDADDRMLSGGLSAMLHAARANDALMVRGQQVATDGTRRWIVGAHQHPDLRTPGRKSVLRNPGLLNNQGPPGKLYHRSLAEGLRFEGRIMGDGPWICRATIRAGDRVYVVADEVYEYRRPAPGLEVSTITADRERSTGLAIEGVAMAERGWRLVSAAWADLGTAEDRHRLDVAYLDRIVRADVAIMLVRSVLRRDPRTRELLEALAAMLRSLPDDVVADTRSIGDRLVRPVVAFWWRLPVDARPAFGALVAAARPGGADRVRRAPAGILRNPGTRQLSRGGARGLAALAVAWPQAAGSLAIERVDRRIRGVRFP
jgi:glycosyltransferase involved in cell wall biosynthesis